MTHRWGAPERRGHGQYAEIVTRCTRCRAELREWVHPGAAIAGERAYFDGALVDDLLSEPGCDPDARVCACGLAVIDKYEDSCVRCADATDADVAERCRH